MGTYVDKLKEYEKELKSEKEGLTITVSGSSGSGKTTVSKTVAKKFDLIHINVGDLFRKIAKQRNLELSELSGKREREIDYKADKETLRLAKKGNVVINGRLTGWVAGDNADVKIYIKCDLDVKAKRVAKRENKSFEQAKRDLKKRDENDTRVYKEIYNIDVEDLSIYDLVIDNTNISYEELKQKVIEKVRNFFDKEKD